MKKISTLLLSLAMGVGTMFASVEIDGLYYNLNENDLTAEVAYSKECIFGYTMPSLVIPASVTYESKEYSVTRIGNRAFSGLFGGNEVTIPNSIISIGDSAFRVCPELTKINLGTGVTEIGKEAFAWCPKLESITIPNGVTCIKEATFCMCDKLQSVTLPESLKKIDARAFQLCKSLNNVNLPNGLDSIGIQAFHACYSLTEISIPNSVKKIGASAFYGDTVLTKISIGSGIETLEPMTFSECKALDTVIVNIENPLYIYSTVFYNVDLSNIVLMVPAGSVEAYMEADVWKNFKEIQPLQEMTAIRTIQRNDAQGTKVIRDGKCYIVRGGKMYTLQGQEVR